MIIQFEEKRDCCGCTACVNICPKQAIVMEPDVNGFIFPKIDHDLCIECGRCIKVCAYQNILVSGDEPLATYVAINKSNDILFSSASGGLFGALANLILNKNGVIFGCVYDDDMEPKHMSVENMLNIKRIQGSKYVQSDINTTYTEAKKYLNEGRWVLYTGTPCQIAGLKSYIGKNYETLITADIICHGVPSAEFFKGYIKHLEGKLKGRVIDFKFRDKSKGWGLMGKVIYKKGNKILEKFINPQTSYYYDYFLKGYIYRENCYECKYACSSREGDFTMGDYWGIEKAHPEIETKNGVSVFLINSKKGMSLVDEISRYLNLTESTFEKAREQNGQLNNPVVKSNIRDVILKTWREGGYKAVADEYYKANKKKIIIAKLKILIPNCIKRFMKKIIKR